MRIAHVIPSVSESWGGPVAALKELMPQWAKAGVKTTVWATDYGIPAESEPRTAYLHTFAPDAENQVEVFPMDFPKGWYHSSALAHAMEENLRGTDIIHLHGVWTYTTYIGAELGRKFGIPVILRPAGQFGAWDRGNKPFKKSIYLNTFGRRLLANTTCMHAVSADEKSALTRSWAKHRTEMVPHGINLQGKLAADKLETESILSTEGLLEHPYVLSLGRLSPQKGLDLLLHAWAQIVQDPAFANWKLVLAGPDYQNYKAVLDKIIEDTNISDSVYFPGHVSGVRKSALTHSAKLFAAPSRGENFGVAIAEAAAAAVPILASDQTPWHALVESGGGRLVPVEPASIQSALAEMMTADNDEREKMGRAAQSYILANHEISRVAKKWLDLYHLVLDQNTPR